MASFPPVPPEVKGIAHYLKIAEEHDNRNIVVSYWARMHACQIVMKMLPGKKPPEVSTLLMALIDWLESTKKANRETEGICDETTAQALLEQYAIQLFTFADAQDRERNFNKNTIKAFYTAGILMDVLEQFGDLSEDIINKRKYAKWKAAYIHNCLKAGETPLPGGPDEHAAMANESDEEMPGTSQDTDTFGGPSGSSVPQLPSMPMAPSNPTIPSFMDEPVNPVAPAPAPSPITPVPSNPMPFTPAPVMPSPMSDSSVGPDVIQKAQKYCKYATSALNYDDVTTAIDNLSKALSLLQSGKEE